MSDMGDLIRQTVGAAKAGNVEAVTQESTPAHDTGSDDETVAVASEGLDTSSHSVNTSDPTERESNAKDEDPAASAKDTEGSDSKATGDKETITVTDHKGKRQITVDFSDRAKTKKAYELAAGARKWQAERDQATKEAKEVGEKASKLEQRFNVLEETWKNEGVDGIIKLLSDGKQSLDTVYKERAEREARRLSADPAELAKMDFEEKLAAEQRERAKLQKRIEESEKKIGADKEAAELRNQEAIVHPAFDKFRFEGKLGNEDQELMLDEMMWKRATAKFDEYKEQGIALTPSIVEREFKAMQVALSSMIKQKADTKAAAALEKRKIAATENAQRRVASGMGTSKEEREAHEALATGDMRSFFGNIGKHGKFFRNK